MELLTIQQYTKYRKTEGSKKVHILTPLFEKIIQDYEKGENRDESL